MDKIKFDKHDQERAYNHNARIGMLPVRCTICGLPLGKCLQLVAMTTPGENLRKAFIEAGFGADRLCCRDAGLSRARTVVALARWMGRYLTNVTSVDENYLLQLWKQKYGPLAFLKRAEEEAVTSVIGARVDVCIKKNTVLADALSDPEEVEADDSSKEWRGPWLSVRCTSRSPEPPSLDSSGTRSIAIVGTVEMQLSAHEQPLKRADAVVLRFPSCGAVHGEALRIGSRLYAPLSTATFKRNRIVTTSRKWPSERGAGNATTVDVCFLSMDPRNYEGELDGTRSPSIVPFRLRLESRTRVCQDPIHAAADVPVVTVRDVLGAGESRRHCSLRGWLEILAGIAEIDKLPSTFLALMRDWEDGDECGDAAHQRSLIVQRCFAEAIAGPTPPAKTVRAAFPHLNCLSDQKQRAAHAIRLIAQMLRRGAQVYYRRATPDEPRSSHDYEDIGHSLSCEAILALRLSASGALRAALRVHNGEDPMDSAVRHLHTASLQRSASSLSNKNRGGPTRREVTTFGERRHPVSREISGDTSFATLNGRNVSSHDERMDPRSAKLRDDGFIDHRDTTDSNPGQRSYMSIGTMVSLRAPWPELKEVADRLCQLLHLDDDDPLIPVGMDMKVLTVSGVPIGRFKSSRTVEIECACYHALQSASLLVTKLENVSVEPTSYGFDLNGLPGRLVRPVLVKDVDGVDPLNDTWDSLRKRGVVRLISQDEQLHMQVLPADDFSVKLPRYRMAREIHPVLRNGYRVAQMAQMDNGHPSRASYSLKQAAAGAVNIEMVPTLAGVGKTISTSLLCEGPFLPDVLHSLPEEYVGMPMAITFGCAGGLNQEDSIAVPARYTRGLWIAKDTAVHIPSLKGTVSRQPSSQPSSLHSTAGATIASFRKLHASRTTERLEQVDLIGPADGRIVASFEEANKFVAIVRQFLPLVEGHKIGFLWQKMTLCVDPSPITCAGLEISGVMHSPSQLSRQSPGQLVLGMRHLMTAGRCGSCRLSTTPEDLRNLLVREQWPASDFQAALIATPDISHTGESCVHDDNTGRFLGRRIVLLQHASQTGKNSPILGVSAHSTPGKDGIGCGPRQEPIMGEHHLALGFNASTEECAPDVNLSCGRKRLRAMKVCKSCFHVACTCDDEKQTVLMPPKLAMLVELAGAAQMEVSLEPSKVPAYPSTRRRSRSRSRDTKHSKPTRGQFLQAGMRVPHLGALQPPSIIVKLERGERVLILTGLAACMVGHAFVASLINNGEVALTRVWDSTASVAPCRGSLPGEESFVIRLRSDEQSLLRAVAVWRDLWEEIKDIEDTLREQPEDDRVQEPKRFIFSESRWAVNLVRLYAQGALSVPRFHLSEEGQTIHQDPTSGRILVGAKRADTPSDASSDDVILDCWARAHYEWTSLSDTLVAVPLRIDIPEGPTTLTITGDVTSPLVTAKDLRLTDGSNACAPNLELDLLPRLRHPVHEAPRQVFVGEIRRVPPLASEGNTGIIGGAAASALPFARINEQWHWNCVAGLDLLLKFPDEAKRLFAPTVCPRGLFSGRVPRTEEEAKQFSKVVSLRCDGCAACIDRADHMVSIDIEDIAKSDFIRRAERAAAGRPLRGCLQLQPVKGKTVLSVATGNSGAETGRKALMRAASEARAAWAAALVI